MLGKATRHGGTRKLHKTEVDAIRLWARSTGFGLSVGEQVRVLRSDRSYAMLAPDTLRAILLNHSWPDLTYDRDEPLAMWPAAVLVARALALMPLTQPAGRRFKKDAAPMTSRILFVLLALSLPGLAAAQTHPCDLPQQTAFTVSANTPVTFSLCWPEKDAAGAPAVATQWGVSDNGGARTTIAMTKATPTANSAGKFQFTGTLTLAKGNHSLVGDVCIDDGTGSTICAAVLSPLVGKAKGPGPQNPDKQAVQ